MATDDRGGKRSGNRGPRRRNNNPDGRNQYSGLAGTARANPLAATAAVGSAIALGVFLWSRRNQISEQVRGLADQVSGWRERGSSAELASEDSSRSERMENPGLGSHGSARTQTEIAEEALTLKQVGETG